MKRSWLSWPKRFARWLFSSPFREIPPLFGNTVPSDLLVFEAQAKEARRHGLGGVAAQLPVPHRKTQPTRQDSALERQ
jgi:hypothetical protein